VFVNITSSRQNQVAVQFAWEWGIWISCFVSALGTCIAAMLGGPIPQTNDPELFTPAPLLHKRRQARKGRTLHWNGRVGAPSGAAPVSNRPLGFKHSC